MITHLIICLVLCFLFFSILAFGLCRSASNGDELLDENELNDGSTRRPKLPVDKLIK